MMTPASSHHLENATFRQNFFNDFSDIIKKAGGAKNSAGEKVPIKSLDKCDFAKIYDHWLAKTEAKKNKNLSKAEKEAAKAEKDKLEAPFSHCLWDGRKQKVGNFRVEPPSLFRGRGEHPKTGRVKTRVWPEQITINIGKKAKVPEPPKGHKWKAVQHDQKATWLAMWQENINGAYKYVMLGAASDVKGQSDFKKFEKARELKKHIDKIRREYTKELKSEIMADRQRATAMYLIDKLALRAGNEKDTENEADTVGCCSLKYEHITLEPPNNVTFDFLGKDSIRYNETAKVDAQVFKNLKLFKKPPKADGDDLFDRLTTSQLNKHLNSYMQGLTAKVFRTYNASFTMSRLLRDLEKDPRSKGTIAEKVKLYNDCNREVAILCNHKRSVGAGHEQQMQKLGDRIKGLRYQQWRTKMMMLDIDPSQKKKKGAAYFQIDEDIDKEWILEHQLFLIEEQRTKITKKFEKENEKRKADKEKALPEKELKERLLAVKELEAKFKKENKTNKVEAEGRGPTVEKFVAAVEKLDDRVKVLETQAEDRDGNKEVALGTSKIVSQAKRRNTGKVQSEANMCARITSTLVSQLSFRRSLTFLLRSSSRRLCETSSAGPSSRWRMPTIGNFKKYWIYAAQLSSQVLIWEVLLVHFYFFNLLLLCLSCSSDFNLFFFLCTTVLASCAERSTIITSWEHVRRQTLDACRRLMSFGCTMARFFTARETLGSRQKLAFVLRQSEEGRPPMAVAVPIQVPANELGDRKRKALSYT